MQDHKKHLTPTNLATTAQVLQAIDIESEQFYVQNLESKVSGQIGASESDVAEFVENFNATVPGHILLMNGNGYRILLSLLVNILMAIEQHQLAVGVIESREEESL